MDTGDILKKVFLTILLIAIGFSSVYWVSGIASSTDFHSYSLKTLDDKKMTVVKLTGAAAAAATAISAVPGDATSPIANEIMDMASYLLIITGVIFLEKLLLTLTGLIAFKYLIPVSCFLGIIYIYSKKDILRNLALKLSIFGLVIFIVVPVSVYVSSWIENNYKDTINVSIESAENLNATETNEEEKEENGENTENAEKEENGENEESTENKEQEKKEENKEENKEEKEEEKKGGILSGLFSKAQNLADTVTETVTTGVTEGAEKANLALSRFIDAIAVLIITSCVIPILILVFFVWIIKIIFGINVTVPPRRRRRKEKNIDKDFIMDIDRIDKREKKVKKEKKEKKEAKEMKESKETKEDKETKENKEIEKDEEDA